MRIYQVGGAVRDRLLGLSPEETDWVVTGACIDDMLAEGFRRIDPDIPVFLHPDTGEEYALARRETKKAPGHKGFTFEYGVDVSIEEDLIRRDLTVNAMAQDADGNVVDPFGGRADLADRRLRHVSSAFVEDPLRVLRLARFTAQLDPFHFVVDDATAALARSMSEDEELLSLTPSRCWRELAKALATPAPARYLEHLAAFGALRRLMPWLDGIAERSAGQPDVCEALDAAARRSADPGVRLAAACLAARRGGASGMPPADWPLPRTIRGLIRECLTHPLPRSRTPEPVLAWLEAMDAWRRTQRLQAALVAWQAANPAEADGLAYIAEAARAAARTRPPAGSTDPRRDVRQARLTAIAEVTTPRSVSR